MANENTKEIATVSISKVEVLPAVGEVTMPALDLNVIKNSDDAANAIKHYQKIGSMALYNIGEILWKVQENKLVDDIVAWGEMQFQYKKAFIYQLIACVKQFTPEQVGTYGVSKLAAIGSSQNLKKLEETRDICPLSTLKEVKDAKREMREEEQKAKKLAKGEEVPSKIVLTEEQKAEQERDKNIKSAIKKMKKALEYLEGMGMNRDDILKMLTEKAE